MSASPDQPCTITSRPAVPFEVCVRCGKTLLGWTTLIQLPGDGALRPYGPDCAAQALAGHYDGWVWPPDVLRQYTALLGQEETR